MPGQRVSLDVLDFTDALLAPAALPCVPPSHADSLIEEAQVGVEFAGDAERRGFLSRDVGCGVLACGRDRVRQALHVLAQGRDLRGEGASVRSRLQVLGGGTELEKNSYS